MDLSLANDFNFFFPTHPHVSDYILLKTQMGDENRWQIELLQRFGIDTFREIGKGSELT